MKIRAMMGNSINTKAIRYFMGPVEKPQFDTIQRKYEGQPIQNVFHQEGDYTRTITGHRGSSDPETFLFMNIV